MLPLLRLAICGLSLLALRSGPLHAQSLPTPPTPDWQAAGRAYNEEALRGISVMLRDWRTSWARDDSRAVSRYYTPDALFLFGEGRPIQGRDAIERELAATLGGTGDVHVGIDDFSASGNIAYAHGRFWYTPESGGEIESSGGTYVLVFRREGRSWRIRAQIFNPDAPTESAEG
ncbi:MAG: nuclear transport factor 2 family protein [Gemmatimonadota bacterium]|nr:nuclear transport factor 2 family protein [Gemmatimonadota bacterium]